MKIIIEVNNHSEGQIDELKEYLEDNHWIFDIEDKTKNIPKYVLATATMLSVRSPKAILRKVLLLLKVLIELK